MLTSWAWTMLATSSQLISSSIFFIVVLVYKVLYVGKNSVFSFQSNLNMFFFKTRLFGVATATTTIAMAMTANDNFFVFIVIRF